MPLSPPYEYKKTRFIHRIGLLADRPAATDVLPGTLYFSEDVPKLERSDGTAWDDYGGSIPGPTGPAGPTGPTGPAGPLVNHASTHENTGIDPILFPTGIKERSRSIPMGEWTPFTPTWTSTGAAPSIGDGLLAGRYTLVGKTCSFITALQIGSTTTVGSGVWIFTLPVPAFTSGLGMAAPALLQDVGTAAHLAVVVAFADGLRVLIQAAAGQVGPTVPFTWISGDIMNYSATYEVA